MGVTIDDMGIEVTDDGGMEVTTDDGKWDLLFTTEKKTTSNSTEIALANPNEIVNFG